jgi:hypothetical protein
MYWNNPIIELTYPSSTQDPIVDSLHNGAHCLFYNPSIDKTTIRYEQKLVDICNWANRLISECGIDGFINDPVNHYDIANIVKLNMWIDDIIKQGIVKPVNLYYDGQEKYGINNGESRLRAIERIPNVNNIAGFICCRAEFADQFADLESITNFNRFAEICGSSPGHQFFFTLTDPEAPYGIFWYEYASPHTQAVTPPEKYCVDTLHAYLSRHPDTKFTPEWFDTLVDWADYKSNN